MEFEATPRIIRRINWIVRGTWKVNGGVVVRLRREEDEVREGGGRDSLQTEEETKNAVG